MTMILVNETNSRPAKARDLQPGDVYVALEDPSLKANGATWGTKVASTGASRFPHRIVIREHSCNRALNRDADVLIWTGGPVQGPPVNGVYPRS